MHRILDIYRTPNNCSGSVQHARGLLPWLTHLLTGRHNLTLLTNKACTNAMSVRYRPDRRTCTKDPWTAASCVSEGCDQYNKYAMYCAGICLDTTTALGQHGSMWALQSQPANPSTRLHQTPAAMLHLHLLSGVLLEKSRLQPPKIGCVPKPCHSAC